MKIKNKIALITGGNSGIGAAIARLFAEEGASLMLTARREEKLEVIANEINNNGGHAEIYSGDVSKEEDCKAMVEAAMKKFGRIDILVNNAGYSGSSDIAERYNSEILDTCFKTNVYGSFYMYKYCVPYMEKQGGGSIVNISSNSVLMPTGYMAYAASKGAQKTMAMTFAYELAAKKIRVNTVFPGLTRTPMVGSLMDDPELLKRYGEAIPLGRVAEPIDIAKGVLFLASDDASMITGAELPIDGGISI